MWLVRGVVVEGGEAGEVGSPQGPTGHHHELSFYAFAKGSPWRVSSLEAL